MKRSTVQIVAALLFAILSCTSSYGVTPYQKVDLGYGDWSKSWFADDFGDPMYDKPYIQTELKDIRSEYPWRFLYIQYSNTPEFGEVVMMKVGANGDNIYVEGDTAILKIKDASGNISIFNAPVTKGSIIIVGNDILSFGNQINAGDYSLALTFHSYLDYGGQSETWAFNCTNETKAFWGAVESLY